MFITRTLLAASIAAALAGLSGTALAQKGETIKVAWGDPHLGASLGCHRNPPRDGRVLSGIVLTPGRLNG